MYRVIPLVEEVKVYIDDVPVYGVSIKQDVGGPMVCSYSDQHGPQVAEVEFVSTDKEGIRLRSIKVLQGTIRQGVPMNRRRGH